MGDEETGAARAPTVGLGNARGQEADQSGAPTIVWVRDWGTGTGLTSGLEIRQAPRVVGPIAKDSNSGLAREDQWRG